MDAVRVLLVGRRHDSVEVLRRHGRRAQRAIEVDVADTPVLARQRLTSSSSFDVVLVDLDPDGHTGLDGVEELTGAVADMPVVAIGRRSDDQVGIEAMRRGAQDYLVVERLTPEGLTRALDRAVERHAFVRSLAHSQRRLEAAERRLRTIVDTNVDPLVVVDGDGIVRFANPAARRLFDRHDEGIVGTPFGFPTGGGASTEIELLTSDGPQVAEMRSAEVEWEESPCVLVSLRDVTLRTARQQRIETLNRFLRAVQGVNRLIVRVKDRSALIAEATRVLVEARGFDACWIVLVDEDGVVDIAHAGLDDGAVESLIAAFEGGEAPPCCRSGGGSRPVARTRIERDCATCVLREAVPGSCALVTPLQHEEKSYGYLGGYLMSAPEQIREEVDLLHEIADDLAFALYGIASQEAKQRTERLLAEAERVAHVGAWVWDLDQDELVFSDEWRRIHGCNDKSLKRSDLLDIAHPEDLDRILAAHRRVLEDGERYEIEHRVVRQDTGETRWVRAHGRRSDSPDGRWIFGAASDITDEHRAMERLRFQARILASVGEAVIVTDREGRIAYWNRAAERLYGWTEDEVLGRPVVEMTPASEAEDAASAIMTAPARGEPWSGEFSVRRKDGSSFDAYVSLTPVTGDDGELEAVIGVSADVSDRKRAERQLVKANRRLDAAVDAGRIGLFDWDMETDKVSYSSEWKRQIGYEDHEISDDLDEWRSRVHPDDLQPTIERIQSYLASGDPSYHVEFRFRHRDGHYLWILTYASAIRDEGGRPVRLVGSHVDITELRRSEQRRMEAEAQLQHAQRMESIGRLAGGVAHDFNNILQVMKGCASMLEDVVTEEDSTRELVEEIDLGVDRAADLTRQLLAFARKQAVSPRVIDLNAAIESMLKMLGRLIGEDIELEWTPGEQVWPVKMDPGQVDQVLANLVVNARDAIDGAGAVTIRTDAVTLDDTSWANDPEVRPGEYAALVVKDTGRGMDDDTRERIFEPFFSTKELGAGTGLGLATVYGIVRQNRGLIEVESAPGEGSTFTVYLPREAEEATAATDHRVAPAERGSETVLLVEDDAQLLDLVRKQLESLGYTVLAAGRPEDALRIAAESEEEIHLLLTDVIMPGMDGRQLFRRLAGRDPDLRCLFMSGYTADVLGRRGVIDDGQLIQKPFSFEALATKLRSALAERERPRVR